MRKTISLLLLALIGSNKIYAQQIHPDMTWFKDAKFGMFIHWGLYAHTAGDWNGHVTKGGEHFMLYEKIPVKTYAKIADVFNPKQFNADKWVKQAKDAGMKYIVYTTKHHDGFAMYNSAASDYNIYKAPPFKRDPLAELAAACKKYDIKLCLYYSLGRDWQDPDVPTNWPTKAGRSNTWDYPDEDGKVFSKYFERKVKPQIQELLTHYGPVAVLWFDTPELISKSESSELRRMIASIQPGCLVNSRIGNGFGDFDISEQKLSSGMKKYWEACLTIGKNWGYNKHDSTWKSSELIVRNLINVVANNGNLLLNVGPTGKGIFPDWAVSRLDSVGEWMKTNGQAITGTHPYKVIAEGNEKENLAIKNIGKEGKMADAVFDGTPKSLDADIFFTAKNNDVFVFLRSWNKKEFEIKSLKGILVANIQLLGGKGKLSWKSTDTGIAIVLPDNYAKVNKIPVYTLKVSLK